MVAIQVEEPLYERIRVRAAAAGYASVDAYVADMLAEDAAEPQDVHSLFTPERLAALDRIVKSIDEGGKLLTEAEVDVHFRARRDSWRGK